jgi:hypothetical protein
MSERDWDLRLLFLKDGRIEKRPGTIIIDCPSGKVQMSKECENAPWIQIAQGEEQVDFNLLLLNGSEINHNIGDFIVDSNKAFSLNLENEVVAEYEPGSFSQIPTFMFGNNLKIIFFGEMITLRIRRLQLEAIRRYMDEGFYFFPGNKFLATRKVVRKSHKITTHKTPHFGDWTGNWIAPPS